MKYKANKDHIVINTTDISVNYQSNIKDNQHYETKISTSFNETISYIDKSSNSKSNKLNNENENVKDFGNEAKLIMKKEENSHWSYNQEALNKTSSKTKSTLSTKEISPETNPPSDDTENIKISPQINNSKEHNISLANIKSSDYIPSSPSPNNIQFNQNLIINNINNQVSKNIDQIIGITRPSSLSFPNNQGGNNFNKKGKQQIPNRNQFVKGQNQFATPSNIPSFTKIYKPNRQFYENDSNVNSQNILTTLNNVPSNKQTSIIQPNLPIAFLSPQLNKIKSPTFPSNMNFLDLDESKNNQNSSAANGILSGMNSAPQTEHLNILNFMSGLNNSIKYFPNNSQVPNQQVKYNGYQVHLNTTSTSMQNRGNTVENLHVLQSLKVGPTLINLADPVQRESISQYAEVRTYFEIF